MLDAVVRRCEVPAGKHFFNVDTRGNTGAAGAPSVFSEHWNNPALGNAVAVCVVGSGLTWAGALLERQHQS
jgi:3-oxoacyl-[acyl-carrier-protein] synthase-3